MKVLVPGRGSAHPMENDCVRVMFTGWMRDGSIFSTAGLHGQSDVQCLSGLMPGLGEALKTMTVGEKRRIWIPASLTISQKRMDNQTPIADLTFDVRLVQILRAPPVPRDLKDPPKNAVKMPHESVFRVLKKGRGTRHPSLTSEVMLHVSGWTSDGKLFQSTVRGGHPAMFFVGDTPSAWREALQEMVVGEKVRLWTGGSDAFGERRSESLVYEIELLALR